MFHCLICIQIFHSHSDSTYSSLDFHNKRTLLNFSARSFFHSSCAVLYSSSVVFSRCVESVLFNSLKSPQVPSVQSKGCKLHAGLVLHFR